MSTINTFEALLAKGPDSALLRYSLGNAYAADKDFEGAVTHLKVALEHDEAYSAAWKLLGRCYLELADFQSAVSTYEQGIQVATDKGDKQAAKEMTVFLRRARKNLGA